MSVHWTDEEIKAMAKASIEPDTVIKAIQVIYALSIAVAKKVGATNDKSADLVKSLTMLNEGFWFLENIFGSIDKASPTYDKVVREVICEKCKRFADCPARKSYDESKIGPMGMALKVVGAVLKKMAEEK